MKIRSRKSKVGMRKVKKSVGATSPPRRKLYGLEAAAINNK